MKKFESKVAKFQLNAQEIRDLTVEEAEGAAGGYLSYCSYCTKVGTSSGTSIVPGDTFTVFTYSAWGY